MKLPRSLNPFKAAAGSPFLIKAFIRLFLAGSWFTAGIIALLILMIPVSYLTISEEEREESARNRVLEQREKMEQEARAKLAQDNAVRAQRQERDSTVRAQRAEIESASELLTTYLTDFEKVTQAVSIQADRDDRAGLKRSYESLNIIWSGCMDVWFISGAVELNPANTENETAAGILDDAAEGCIQTAEDLAYKISNLHALLGGERLKFEVK